MESVDRDTVVRIRISPSSGNCCVINRQNLNELLSGLYGPVNKQFQVAEVPDTEAAAAF